MARLNTGNRASKHTPNSLLVDPPPEHTGRALTAAERQAKYGHRSRGKGTTLRYPFGVRLQLSLNDRLTTACRQLSLGPQHVIENALIEWFDANNIPADLTPLSPSERPLRPRTVRKRTYDKVELEKLTIRVLPLTDARLTYACEAFEMGPQDIADIALRRYFHIHLPRR